MRMYVVLLALTTVAAPLHAQSAETDVCITIDEARDTLSAADRTAALLLVARQFEMEGRQVVSAACAAPYAVSHIRLGDTIIVTLAGTSERREGTARGLDDLPALYSQMVRSIVTGRPMTGFNVVDRTNVTMAQATPRPRVGSDSFKYARLGYGGVFGDRVYGTPAMGFGYRRELDSFALDISFLNLQVPAGDQNSSNGAVAGSLLKLEAFHFLNPKANASTYIGGGLSWGGSEFGHPSGGRPVNGVTTYRSSWEGSGIQGELTVGREMLRASSLRMFVQADAVLPFFQVRSTTHSYALRAPTVTTTEHRYASSLVVSLGLGWQRHRERP